MNNDMKILNYTSLKHERELRSVKEENARLTMQINALKVAQEKHTQKLKANAFDIKDIPPQKNKNLFEIFQNLITVFQITDINTTDVDNIYRVKSKDTIFVNMIRRVDKQLILSKSKQINLKTTDFGIQPETKIYVNITINNNI